MRPSRIEWGAAVCSVSIPSELYLNPLKKRCRTFSRYWTGLRNVVQDTPCDGSGLDGPSSPWLPAPKRNFGMQMMMNQQRSRRPSGFEGRLDTLQRVQMRRAQIRAGSAVGSLGKMAAMGGDGSRSQAATSRPASYPVTCRLHPARRFGMWFRWEHPGRDPGPR